MASTKIKGITIEIGGETTKLGKALESAEKSSKSLQSELKGVNTLLKMDPGNVDLLRQKQDLLTKSISTTEDKLKTLKETMKQIKSGEVEVTEEQFRDLQREIVLTESKLKTLKDQSKNFGSVLQQQMDVAGKKVKDVGGKVEEAGNKMKGLSAGAAAGLGAAVMSAATLEGAVNKVTVATGAGTNEAGRYKDILTKIHDNNFGEDYNDIAEKVSFVKQNMLELNDTDLQKVTENAYLLQDAFGMDFNESIRGINGLMQNMGLSAQEAFDFMVKGAQNGLNKSDELGDNIAEYSQLWGQAGFSAEEMFTILQNGLDNGAYNLDKVNDLVKEMGISLTDGKIEKNLSSFSSETQTLFNEWKTGGASQADVIKSIINDLGNMENEQEALSLASTVWSALGEDNALAIITSLNDVNDTYANTTGTIDSANEQMYSGTTAKAETAIRSIKTAFAELGNMILPILAPIADKITEIAKKNAELDPNIQRIKLVILAIVASIAPLLIFIGKVISAVGTIISVVSKLTPLFTAIKAGLAAVVGALGWPIIAITAVIAVIVLLWTKCEWFRNMIKSMWEGIKVGFQAAIEFLTGVFYSIGEFFVNLWNDITTIFSNVASWFDTYVVQPISNAFQAIMNFINTYIIIPIQTLWNNYIFPIASKIIEINLKIVEIIYSIFKGIAIWIYQTVIQPIINFVLDFSKKVAEIIKSIWNTIVSIFSKVFGWVNSNIIQPVLGAINSFRDAAFKVFSSIWNKIVSIFGAVGSWFGARFGEAYSKITSIFSKIGSFFSGIWSNISSTFSKLGSTLGSAIGDAVKSGINGVISMIEKTINKAVGLINGAIDLINKLPGVSVGKISKLSLPRLANGNVAKKPMIAEFGEYPGAKRNPEITSPQSIMRDTFMDALTDFTNIRSQGNSEIKTLTNLMDKYMPAIISNMGQNIVLDDNTLVGKLTPKIDRSLGDLSSRRKRGH